MIKEQLFSLAEKTCDFAMNLRRYPEPRDSLLPRPPIVAHRGAWNLHDRIENTEPAFREALRLGAWGVEFDVHFTRDQVPILQHDPDLVRCCQVEGVICELSAEEVRARAPSVMLLSEVLRLAPLHFMIEVKSPLSKEQQEVLNSHLAALTPGRDYHLLVLDAGLIFESAKTPMNAWVLVGDLGLSHLVDVAIDRRLGGVAGHYLFMTDSLVTKLHAKGLKAGVGFTPTANLYLREWARGIDWVFTNHLSRLSAQLASGPL